MAFIHKQIRNTKTGQTIQFLQTATDTKGSLLEMESSFAPHSTEPVAHYHPKQAEDFTILEGTLTVRINGKIIELTKGQSLHLPANTIHAMWNATDVPAVVNWKVQPALNTEHLLETGVGIANDQPTNAKGMPGLLQSALIVQHFSNVYRLASPPYLFQRLFFAFLTPIAYLAGYRPFYKKYID
jgi:quercetin dioxygenase-like cupin family protein